MSMGKRYKVKHIKMSEEEQREWARQYVELVLDMVEKELGSLPPPPSEEEFHRLWNEVMQEKYPHLFDTDTTHNPS